MIPVVGSLDAHDTLRDASETLTSLDINPLPVRDAEKLVGLLWQAEVEQRAVHDLLKTGTVLVSEVMDRDFVCVSEDLAVSAAVALVQKSLGSRTASHVPVTNDQGALIGLVPLHDLRTRARTDTSDETVAHGGETARGVVDLQEDPVEFGSDASFPASDPPAQSRR